MQWRRDPRGTGALYVLSGTFLWCAVLLLVFGFGMLFYSDGQQGSNYLGWGAILIGLAVSVAATGLPGLLLAAAAFWFSRDRRRLWPLWLPALLIGLHVLLVVLFSTVSGPRDRAVAEAQLLLLGHLLGYVSVALLAGLWISRMSVLVALLAGALFVGVFARPVLAQYWALAGLAELDSRFGNAVHLDDYRLEVPWWVAAATGAGEAEYRLRTELVPPGSIEDPRGVVALSPRLFGESATASAYVALSVAHGRSAELVVPDFVRVAGPGRIRGGCPDREVGLCRAAIFESDGMSWPRWLRAGQVNQVRCTLDDAPASSACTIESPLP